MEHETMTSVEKNKKTIQEEIEFVRATIRPFATVALIWRKYKDFKPNIVKEDFIKVEDAISTLSNIQREIEGLKNKYREQLEATRMFNDKLVKTEAKLSASEKVIEMAKPFADDEWDYFDDEIVRMVRAYGKPLKEALQAYQALPCMTCEISKALDQAFLDGRKSGIEECIKTVYSDTQPWASGRLRNLMREGK